MATTATGSGDEDDSDSDKGKHCKKLEECMRFLFYAMIPLTIITI
jgi:hypothetical protein